MGVLKMDAPNYANLNYLISCVMAGVTASLRFPGKLNSDLRKLGVNLVPFPRLHFFLIAQAPLQSKDNKAYQLVNVQELTNQCFSPRNFFSNVKPDDGKYMTASLIFRGPMSTQEVDENVEKRQSANSDDFVEWIPNNMKTSVVEVAPKDAQQSCTFTQHHGTQGNLPEIGHPVRRYVQEEGVPPLVQGRGYGRDGVPRGRQERPRSHHRVPRQAGRRHRRGGGRVNVRLCRRFREQAANVTAPVKGLFLLVLDSPSTA